MTVGLGSLGARRARAYSSRCFSPETSRPFCSHSHPHTKAPTLEPHLRIASSFSSFSRCLALAASRCSQQGRGRHGALQ